MDSTNYYEILEIPPDAPPHEIHKAYQRARATYSADNPALYSMFSPEEARELLRLIEEAYSVLGNNLLRRNYDDALRSGNAPQPGAGAAPVASTMMPGATPPPTITAPPQPVAPSPAAIASQHQSLPDFSTPEKPVPSAPKKLAHEPLPPGMGRTSLSTYKIDDAFEAEIKNAADFDGNFLQKVRLYRNISIDRMSDSTRISRPYLMAVETNDYKALPAAVFVRGFVVQVARALGLDENKVATSYIKLFKAGGGK